MIFIFTHHWLHYYDTQHSEGLRQTVVPLSVNVPGTSVTAREREKDFSSPEDPPTANIQPILQFNVSLIIHIVFI